MSVDGWSAVRGVQEMCEALRRAEAEWSTTHFAELKTARWLILTRAIHSVAGKVQDTGDERLSSFSALRGRLTDAWRQWISMALQPRRENNFWGDDRLSTPPAPLVATPVPLGQMVVHAAVLPNSAMTIQSSFRDWVGAFAKKPADIQLLVWLHMLAPRPSPKPDDDKERLGDATELVLWNLVTVLQNSPLPFIARAKLTLLAYQNRLELPIAVNAIAANAVESSSMSGGISVSLAELTELATKGGVRDHWNRSLWESLFFESTPSVLRTEIRDYLTQSKSKAPESDRVYELLSKLDAQNHRRMTSLSHDAILAYMLHVTNTLSMIDPRPTYEMPVSEAGLVSPTLVSLLSGLVGSLGDSLPTLNPYIVRLGKILHIHSLMTLAQMRRATSLFWTLVYALSLKLRSSQHSQVRLH